MKKVHRSRRPPTPRAPLRAIQPGYPAARELSELLLRLDFPASEVEARTATVRREAMSRSPRVTGGNFAQIGTADLALLFELYDRIFFSGALSRALDGNGDGRLQFRLSDRMTSAGGKAFHYPGRGPNRSARYEIAISTHLLFLNFGGEQAPLHVNGRVCRDRLDALQRVFEHELVHLTELLVSGSSSCRRAPFRDLARRVFGHTDVTHRLATVRQKALTDHGLKVGDRVSFSFDGSRHVGFVNRITKRATVLVEDPGGARYTDGKRYQKYYVPLGGLEKE